MEIKLFEGKPISRFFQSFGIPEIYFVDSPFFHFSNLKKMLSIGQRIIKNVNLGYSSILRPVISRGLMGTIPQNANRPTPLSIQTLKAYAESQDNMPVRLSLAQFLQSELPQRFAVWNPYSYLGYRRQLPF